ncbi:MAG: hypothetical protein U1E68_10905 [Sphingomonadaceae bacterium]|jgi:mRNA-degrading endonuclease RelE of RelBE toxin-antitoxin system
MRAIRRAYWVRRWWANMRAIGAGASAIIARIEDARVVILVVRVGHRREVYR